MARPTDGHRPEVYHIAQWYSYGTHIVKLNAGQSPPHEKNHRCEFHEGKDGQDNRYSASAVVQHVYFGKRYKPLGDHERQLASPRTIRRKSMDPIKTMTVNASKMYWARHIENDAGSVKDIWEVSMKWALGKKRRFS